MDEKTHYLTANTSWTHPETGARHQWAKDQKVAAADFPAPELFADLVAYEVVKPLPKKG